MSEALVVPENVGEPTPPADVPASGSELDVNGWETLSGSDDYDDAPQADVGAHPQPAAAPESSAPAPATAPQSGPAPVSPPPAAAQAQAPAASPTTPAAAEPAATVQPAAPSSQPSFEEQLAARVAQLTADYAIPAEDATALLTEPETVLPKLAARVHQNIVTEMWQSLHATLPQVIAGTVQGMLREQEARNAFFTAWPELRPYEAQVKQTGMFYRSMNPQAPADVAIKTIGELVMAALGLTRNTPPASAPTPKPATRPAAFAPGGVGSAGAPVAPPDQNPFTAMAFDPD